MLTESTVSRLPSALNDQISSTAPARTFGAGDDDEFVTVESSLNLFGSTGTLKAVFPLMN